MTALVLLDRGIRLVDMAGDWKGDEESGISMLLPYICPINMLLLREVAPQWLAGSGQSSSSVVSRKMDERSFDGTLWQLARGRVGRGWVWVRCGFAPTSDQLPGRIDER